MAVKSTADKYANKAAVQVIESAAATQTSAKFAFPFSIMDKMALLINRIEYYPDISKLNSNNDFLYLAVTAASSLTQMDDQSDPRLIDSASFHRIDIGTAASGLIVDYPYIKDFSDLPGGGILVAPNPLYAMAQAVGTSSATISWIAIYYTYLQLSADDYWQLVESRRIISN